METATREGDIPQGEGEREGGREGGRGEQFLRKESRRGRKKGESERRREEERKEGWRAKVQKTLSTHNYHSLYMYSLYVRSTCIRCPKIHVHVSLSPSPSSGHHISV